MRFLDFFDQTSRGLGLGNLFPARESLVSDFQAGDGNTAKPFFTVYPYIVQGYLYINHSTYTHRADISLS